MLGDHAYLGYVDDDALRAPASGFLREGLELGQRVAYYGWGAPGTLREHVGSVPGLDERIQRGELRIMSLEERFRADDPPDASSLVSYWSGETASALAAGFTALRVVTDTTPWVRTQPKRARFLRTEHQVDRFRVRHPFTQLCVGDSQVLDRPALAEAGCIHPSTEGFTVPFHLHATGNGADFALGGELDVFALPLLERVLAAVDAALSSSEVVIDATGLTFVDHRSLIVLERHLEQAGVQRAVLRGARPAAGRLAALLELDRISVEVAS